MFAILCFFVCCFVLNISTVARVVGELRVGAAVGRRVPYVQVHVWAERVEVGVLDRSAGALWLPGEGRARRGDGGHGGHRGRPLRLEVALVGLALRRPDGAEQAGHGGEAAGSREVWLKDEKEENRKLLSCFSELQFCV